MSHPARTSPASAPARGRDGTRRVKLAAGKIVISPADIRRVDRFARRTGPPSAEGPLLDALAHHYCIEPSAIQLRLVRLGCTQPHQPDQPDAPPSLVAIVTAGEAADDVHTIQLPAVALAWYRERSAHRDAVRPLQFTVSQCEVETAHLVRHPEGRGRVRRIDPFLFEGISPADLEAKIKRVRAALAHAWGLLDQPDAVARRAVAELSGDAPRQAAAGYTADDLRSALDRFAELTLPWEFGWTLRRSTLEAAKQGDAR